MTSLPSSREIRDALRRQRRRVEVIESAFIDASVRRVVATVRARLSQADAALLRPSAQSLATAARLVAEATARLDNLTKGTDVIWD